MSDLISRKALLEKVKAQLQDALHGAEVTGQTRFKQKATDCKNFIDLIEHEHAVTDINVGVKWHYLDKNPDDLPKHNGWYIICHGTEWTNGKLTHNSKKNYDSEIRMCEFFDGKWQKLGMIIAWCEKPEHPYKGERHGFN